MVEPNLFQISNKPAMRPGMGTYPERRPIHHFECSYRWSLKGHQESINSSHFGRCTAGQPDGLFRPILTLWHLLLNYKDTQDKLPKDQPCYVSAVSRIPCCNCLTSNVLITNLDEVLVIFWVLKKVVIMMASTFSKRTCQ